MWLVIAIKYHVMLIIVSLSVPIFHYFSDYFSAQIKEKTWCSINNRVNDVKNAYYRIKWGISYQILIVFVEYEKSGLFRFLSSFFEILNKIKDFFSRKIPFKVEIYVDKVSDRLP